MPRFALRRLHVFVGFFTIRLSLLPCTACLITLHNCDPLLLAGLLRSPLSGDSDEFRASKTKAPSSGVLTLVFIFFCFFVHTSCRSTRITCTHITFKTVTTSVLAVSLQTANSAQPDILRKPQSITINTCTFPRIEVQCATNFKIYSHMQ